MPTFEGKRRLQPILLKMGRGMWLPDSQTLLRLKGRGNGPVWRGGGESVAVENAEAVFLVGSGPSLADVPPPLLERMRGRALCVNNSWRVVRGAWWIGGDNPHYFPDELWNCGQTLKFTTASHAFTRGGGEQLHKKAHVRFFVRDQQFDHRTFWEGRGWQWGPPGDQKDSLGHRGTRSSFLMALRLLKEMGARRVYLVGVDFDATRDRVYGTGVEVDRKHVERMQASFNVMKRRLRALAPTMPYRVWNCTGGSRVHTFEWMDLEKALDLEDSRGHAEQRQVALPHGQALHGPERSGQSPGEGIGARADGG